MNISMMIQCEKPVADHHQPPVIMPDWCLEMRAPPPAPALLAAHHRGGAPRAPAGACSCGGLAVHQPCCSALQRPGRRPRCAAQVQPAWAWLPVRDAVFYAGRAATPRRHRLLVSSPVAASAWKIKREKRARLKLRSPLLSPAPARRFDSHALQMLLRAQAQL